MKITGVKMERKTKEKIGSYKAHKNNVDLSEFFKQLEKLKKAKEDGCEYFVTDYIDFLRGREKIEKLFDIYIRSTREMKLIKK